ncbi:MAG: Bax inhibitor-1/YccA family protein [Paludibacteraceae bacterium]|nr:Bax inhibitor-1/YccA family protein [Paludibacteraceae bacterium]
MENYIENSGIDQSVVESAQRTLMKNVYWWMALALVVTGLSAFYTASSPRLLEAIFGSGLFIGLIIAELIMVIILSARINKMSFVTAGIVFVIYSLVNGLTLSSILIVYTMESVASTFFITAGTFAAMAIVGTVTKKDLSSIGQILFMALIGLILATIVNIFLKSSMMSYIISYVGVAVFVGLTAYDAQKIKNMIHQYGTDLSDDNMKLALMGSLSLYLDFINLFLYLLRIFGSRRD